jgi:hypothetical protein
MLCQPGVLLESENQSHLLFVRDQSQENQDAPERLMQRGAMDSP